MSAGRESVFRRKVPLYRTDQGVIRISAKAHKLIMLRQFQSDVWATLLLGSIVGDLNSHIPLPIGGALASLNSQLLHI